MLSRSLWVLGGSATRRRASRGVARVAATRDKAHDGVTSFSDTASGTPMDAPIVAESVIIPPIPGFKLTKLVHQSKSKEIKKASSPNNGAPQKHSMKKMKSTSKGNSARGKIHAVAKQTKQAKTSKVEAEKTKRVSTGKAKPTTKRKKGA